MISKFSACKGAEFADYDLCVKKNTHKNFLYLLKCPFNNSKMKAKIRVVYMKKTTCNDRLDR